MMILVSIDMSFASSKTPTLRLELNLYSFHCVNRFYTNNTSIFFSRYLSEQQFIFIFSINQIEIE